MRTMQQKLLERIERAITDVDFEAVQDAHYGNTGVIHVQDKKFYATMMEISYGFHNTNCKFTLTVKGEKIMSQPPRPDYFDFYQEYSDAICLSNFFEALNKGLKSL